jgi:hypothetical protein
MTHISSESMAHYISICQEIRELQQAILSRCYEIFDEIRTRIPNYGVPPKGKILHVETDIEDILDHPKVISLEYRTGCGEYDYYSVPFDWLTDPNFCDKLVEEVKQQEEETRLKKEADKAAADAMKEKLEREQYEKLKEKFEGK